MQMTTATQSLSANAAVTTINTVNTSQFAPNKTHPGDCHDLTKK